jgi:two-component system, chemotaxis family, sensor kinase CheA
MAFIEDDELRGLYQVSSEEHLQKLESGLLSLEKNAEQPDLLVELMREAHSLKGDSRILGLEDIEKVIHKIEDILVGINKEEIVLNSLLSDRLYQGIDALKKMVQEAVTSEPCGVKADEIIEEITGAIPEENTPEIGGSEKEIEVENIELELIETSSKIKEENQDTEGFASLIEDEDLREMYHNSSKKHLERIKSCLEKLEQNRENKEILDELLATAESLKTDSIIIGVESVEIGAEKLEEVLDNLIKNQVNITPEIIQKIQHFLTGIEKLINEAITGKPSQINVENLLSELTDHLTLENEVEMNKPQQQQAELIVQETTPKPELKIEEKPPASPVVHAPKKANIAPPPAAPMVSAPTAGQPYRIDTIRVKTQHLDALMTQTGELTVTKIRIAHTANQVEILTNLWEEWKNRKYQRHYFSENEEVYQEKLEEIIQKLRISASENSTRLDIISDDLEEKISTLRMLPLSTVFQLFPRLVRDLAKQEGKEVEFFIEGGDTAADKQILEEIKDPLMHILRNAVDHGIESPQDREKAGKPRTGTIRLKGYQTASNIVIEVQDDGQGLDKEKIKKTAIKKGMYHPEELELMSDNQIYSLILAPGFSTRSFVTEVSGRGVGLDVLQTNVKKLKGQIQIESKLGEGCTFRVNLGTTLATANVLLVDVAGIVHGIPIEYVQTNLLVSPDNIFTIEGKETIALDNQGVSVASLAQLLELPDKQTRNHKQIPCILLNVGGEKFGVFVDRLIDTQDVVIKPQSKLLKRVRNITGATILGTGEVCMIINPQDLLKSLQRQTGGGFTREREEVVESSQQVVLLAEDSITIRTQEKRILEAAGYEVVTAVDGLDGYNKLRSRHFDAVVSDIQMPNMDGLTLTSKIRELPEYSELPIILVTSLASDEDKRKGAAAGANAYITKGNFNQDILIDTLKRLV